MEAKKLERALTKVKGEVSLSLSEQVEEASGGDGWSSLLRGLESQEWKQVSRVLKTSASVCGSCNGDS